MSVLVDNIVSDVRIALNDLDATDYRWSDAEIMGYLNDAQRNIVLNLPNSYTANEPMILIAGTKQSIPVNGVQFISIVNNLGGNGTTPGRAIRLGQLSDINVARPDWHIEIASAQVNNYFFDERDRRVFYVSPPQPAVGPGYVQIIYTDTPADIALGDNIILDDIYKTPILFYGLYRCYMKEAMTQNKTVAAGYYRLYGNELGIKTVSEEKASPNNEE